MFLYICCQILICMTGYTFAVSLEDQILDGLLNSYEKRTPPGLDFGGLGIERPTNISVKLLISEIYDIDINEMDFTVTCFLRQQWVDHRLQFNYTNIILELDYEDITKIWKPDTFFTESKQGEIQTITKPNKLLHIYHDGTVMYSIRLNLKLSCFMDFQLYPLDVQTCKIHLESYGYTIEKLKYSWYEKDPVVVKNENLPLYSIPENPTTSVTKCHTDLSPEGNYTSNGFSCLEMVIILHRSVGYYMIEVFIPDILIVVLSWVSFWLHPNAEPGRVSLGAITVLTVSSQGSAVRRFAPRVSYVKAIDVWTLFQIVFVFAAMVEFSVVNVLARLKISEQKASESIKKKAATYRESQSNTVDPDKDETGPYLPRAKRIDYISRFAFPGVYLLFNFLFWVIVSNV